MLFLSKLLPLFLYPLGLISLLLGGMGVWAWRRRSPLQWPLWLTLAIVLLSGNFWVSQALTRSLEHRVLAPDPIPPAPVMIVLGGSTHPRLPPRTFPEVAEAGDRLLQALTLYQQKKAPLILLSGGRIGWMGAGAPEAEDMAELLVKMGVPREALILEPDSLNTRQNAQFVKPILTQRGLTPALLITSAFHMPRALRIFEREGIAVIPAPTDYLTVTAPGESVTWQKLLISLLPEAGNLEVTTRALKEYIGLIVANLSS
ncbi:MAG: YdcF family protein [Cyanobacteria bacterium RI_101]|nr:YdcF family protein [Cyanobacteria bacterium RI_101]